MTKQSSISNLLSTMLKVGGGKKQANVSEITNVAGTALPQFAASDLVPEKVPMTVVEDIASRPPREQFH